MDTEVKEEYKRAGKVVQKARKRAKDKAKPGITFKKLAENLEGLIRDEGLQPAFPVNLSVNDEAAHYSPGLKAERTLSEDDILKIDIGVHSNGYIADTALTVNPSGEHEELIEKNEKVLEAALNFLEPGKTVGELGTFIHNEIGEDFRVIRNLTGHSLDQYTQHAGLSIPNIRNSDSHTFQKGQAVAIEPFLTTGTGKIKEGKKGNIYIYQGGNVRGKTERTLLKKIKEFKGLPFTPRWFEDFSARKKMALKKLVQSGVVKHYPVLREKQGAVVSQAEHTVIVGGKDGDNLVTTRP